MFAYCDNKDCDYSTGEFDYMSHVMDDVMVDGGKLEGVKSICPKCKAENSLMLEVISKKTNIQKEGESE